MKPSINLILLIFKAFNFYSIYHKNKLSQSLFYIFSTLEEARSQITDYLTYYNEERFQRKLNGLSPKEFREKAVV
ncbi:IS3 family transposase [Paenibacillus nuruki]|uniref:IS3 family transposase n=1 Tax=Paenibacillus nuruki TaxID=1886670 RepID=UPI002804E3F3|nr:IS3 family transposase [Paenibacillus nuruki]